MTTLESSRGAAATAHARRRPAHPIARAGIVTVAPAWLLAGLLYHPFIPDLTDKASVAAAATADPARWGFSHFTVGLGAALLVLAFLALRSYLGDAGEHRWSGSAVPFIVLGSILFAFLPAMEIAMLGAAGAGADVRAVLVAMDPWFVPTLLAGSATFAVGLACFAVALVRTRVLRSGPAWTVAGLLVLSAATRFVPSGPALTVGGVALVAALWPLAYQMYKRPEPARTEAS
jgi:hypothetical protein